MLIYFFLTFIKKVFLENYFSNNKKFKLWLFDNAYNFYRDYCPGFKKFFPLRLMRYRNKIKIILWIFFLLYLLFSGAWLYCFLWSLFFGIWCLLSYKLFLCQVELDEYWWLTAITGYYLGRIEIDRWYWEEGFDLIIEEEDVGPEDEDFM